MEDWNEIYNVSYYGVDVRNAGGKRCLIRMVDC